MQPRQWMSVVHVTENECGSPLGSSDRALQRSGRARHCRAGARRCWWRWAAWRTARARPRPTWRGWRWPRARYPRAASSGRWRRYSAPSPSVSSPRAALRPSHGRRCTLGIARVTVATDSSSRRLRAVKIFLNETLASLLTLVVVQLQVCWWAIPSEGCRTRCGTAARRFYCSPRLFWQISV